MSNYTRNTLTGDLAPINAELEKVQQSIADKLDRVPSVGQANQLKDVLDANSNRIINLPAPSSPNDAARLVDVAVSTGTSVLPVQTGQNSKYLKTDGTTPFWASVTKAEVGLGNVDNTTDALKPISTPQQTALNLKVNLEGITTTGLISSTTTYSANTIINTIGFAARGGGGAGTWVQNGVTGQTVSQNPAQLGLPLLNDGNGNQWAMSLTNTESFDTFALLQASTSGNVGQELICRGRADATYIIQPSTYSALAGDATLASGLVAALQIDGQCHLAWFGAAQNAESLLDSATDDLAACNLAALRIQQEGGGTVLMSGLSALSGTLVVPQRVIFKGTALFFANQFTNNEVRPAGCGFYALSGLNDDVIDLKLDIYNDGGTLRETVNNKKLTDYRHFGGLKNLIVYGNRSNTANPPTTVDKNTTGSGILCSGVRYPIVKNVVSMMCGEDGVETVSFDYGLGANACNNLKISELLLLSNAGNGGSFSGGDSIIYNIIAGYNGLNGISSTLGSGSVSGECWNNKQDGVNISGGRRVTYNFASYDNQRQGFRITGTNNITVRGSANANGRDTSLSSANRVGVLTGDSNFGLRLDINVDGNGYTESTVFQAYGFNIDNTTNPICVAGCIANNNFTADWLITNSANIIKDTNAP